MPGKKNIDWERIEADYRAGIKTLRQIAEENKITHGAVNKRAKRDKWERDLSEKIRIAARAKVSKAEAVSSKVSKATERDVIDIEATIQSRVALEHRKDIPQKRQLCSALFAEIEALTDGKDLVEQMTLALGQGDMDGLAKLASKVASLPSRVKGFSDLVNAYKSLIGLERQAFGLNESSDVGEEFGEIVRRIVKA